MDNIAYNTLKNKRLTLFFTYRVSLKLWHDRGMMERELNIYKELSNYFKKIFFITYGTQDDMFINELKKYNITVLYKKNKLPNFLYSLCIPCIFRKQLQTCDFYKTNQMAGSWSAVIAKFFFKKKLIVRTGYPLSFNAKRESRIKYLIAKMVEWFAYTYADRASVATAYERDHFSKYQDKIKIIPNYVNTDVFQPAFDIPHTSQHKNLLFIGRLSPEKNLVHLIQALQDIPHITLQLIGTGQQEEELRMVVSQTGVDVEFLGNKPHHELPPYIQKADIFVLPSLYEGNPKVLLEAMACGALILATRVRGIDTIIEHKKNGYLCGTSRSDIHDGLLSLLSETQTQHMREHALQTIQEGYSLKKIVSLELEQYQ